MKYETYVSRASWIILLIMYLTLGSINTYAQKKGAEENIIKTKRTYEPVNQKVPVDKSSVDTLSLLDRLALRTNVVDWTLMIPNIGIEFDIRNTTWNRWAVAANVRYNWQTKHTFTPPIVYNFFEARLEARQYWRARQIGERGLPAHTKIWDKALSIRRSRVKHPTTTWYRGLFISYDKYSLLLSSKGHQGDAIMAGVTYGLIRPLYAFSNGNSIDIEFGISGGFVAYRDATYYHDDVANSYPVTRKNGWKMLPFPIPNELRVGLVYRLGHYPVLSKYRYRRDNDIVYDAHRDSIYQSHVKIMTERRNYKADHEMIERRLWHVYDSIATKNRMKREVKHGK